MLLKVSLDNPSQHDFSDRTSSQLKTAFRPERIDTDEYFIFTMGSIIGLYDSNGKMAQCSARELPQRLKSQKMSELIQNLEGLYLLYIHSKKDNKHFIINNRYQLTKLYYSYDQKNFRCSNQMRTLIEGNHPAPHFPSIINFLKNGFNISEKTQISGVSKLLPCQWIEIEQGKVSVKNFWNKQFSFQRSQFSEIESKVDEYEKLYSTTLNNYLESRRPTELSTLLSGGHDTSFVLAHAHKLYAKPIHCYTVVFPGWNFNENSFAENIAKKFKAHFHTVEFGSSDLDLLNDLIFNVEEPVLGSSLPLHKLAQKASTVTDTILGGDGGDTLWGEYYPVAEVHRYMKSWPLWARQKAHSISKKMAQWTDWERFWELEHVTSLFAKENFYDNFLQDLCTYRHFTDNFLSELLIPEIYKYGPQASSIQIPFDKNDFSNQLIEGKLYNGFYTYQSFQQTRSMNSTGMEFYLPTINKEVINFINSLPMDWINGGNTFQRLTNSKSINRKLHKHALRRYLKKDEIYNRSFDIPWFKIIKNEESLLSSLEKKLLQRGWYQEKTITKLFSEFKSQNDKDYELLQLRSHGYRIMALMALEVWAIQFLDNVTFDPTLSLNETFGL